MSASGAGHRPAASAARAAATLWMALGLVACATRPPADEAMPWTSGRLAVRVEAFDGRPASVLAADFDLRGDGARGELRLSGALGSRLAQARWNREGATLDTGQGAVRYADLDSLSREALGEALPLQALPDWLGGRPWAGAPSVAQADGFAQLGWTVSLTAFDDGRLEAVREAPPPRVVVRVRLDREGR